MPKAGNEIPPSQPTDAKPEISNASSMPPSKAELSGVKDSVESTKSPELSLNHAEQAPTAVPNYHLERQFVQTVNASLITSVSSPQTTDGELRVYAPIPPNIPTQTLKFQSLSCLENPSLQPKVTVDKINPLQRYLCLTIPIRANTLQKCTVRTTYIIDLYSTQLAKGSPVRLSSSNDSSKVGASVAVDPSYFLRESSLADYKSPVFQAWLTKNNLIRDPKESDFEFAVRAFSCFADLADMGSYQPPEKMKASHLCMVPVGDCGALANLFVSILLANDVIATTFPGRWA